MEPWLELDVGDWVVEHQEMRGKRPKYWARDGGGARWLRKEPRETRPTEPAIETSMLRVARAIGLPAPESAACVWRDPAGTERRGIVVRLFLDDQEELSLGSVELSSAKQDYDPQNHNLHTLARVEEALRELERTGPTSLVTPFLEMLAFDAWIGNGDRHQENWGVLRKGGVITRLAPMFDPAACLGVELQPGAHDLAKLNLARYIGNCPSGFGDGTRLIKMPEVLQILEGWPEWKRVLRTSVARFESAMDTVEQVIGQIPHEWLPAERAAFACRLLRVRLEMLSQRCVP
jgi:hypothetical protein